MTSGLSITVAVGNCMGKPSKLLVRFFATANATTAGTTVTLKNDTALSLGTSSAKSLTLNVGGVISQTGVITADTLVAGAGLCKREAVEVTVREGPERIRWLLGLGVEFDRESGERLHLTREGGHSHNRIVHAGGDQSGAEVQRTLDESVQFARVRTVEHAFALDLVTGTDANGNRAVAGVTVAMLDEKIGRAHV